MHATNVLENALVDHLFRTATFAKPAALWIALFTAAPSDPGGGTEVAGGGYVRVNLPPSNTNWAATQGGTSASSGTGGQTSNAIPVTFPVPTAAWGTVTAFGLYDAPTGGVLLIWAPLTTSRPILLGDPAPSFGAGGLTVTVA